MAREIITAEDGLAIKELVNLLETGTTPIKNDCIKVLYEIGETEPKLIAEFLPSFLQTLHSKNNRLQWGAMTAISSIARVLPDEVYQLIPGILEVANNGSVITKDKAFLTLVYLAQNPGSLRQTGYLMLEQLDASAENQFPRYCEQAVQVIPPDLHSKLVALMQRRLPEMQKASSKQRVEKVLKKLNS